MDDTLKQDKERLKLFKKYGYDIPKARNYIIAKAGLTKDGRMLEVGTGRGHMATALAQNGFKLISIDLDKKTQDVARIHLKDFLPALEGYLSSLGRHNHPLILV